MALKPKKVDASGEDVRVQVSYDSHLLYLSLPDGENSQTLLAGTALPTPQSHVLFKNWHLCRVCWEDYESKNSYVPTLPEATTAITRLLKTSRGD